MENMVQKHESADLRRLSIELTAIAESGLAYCDDRFDIERFHRVARLASDLMDMIATNPEHSYNRHVASVAGYTTPKIDVRAGVFDETGRILLVREIADHDRWTIPGGWCDVLESPTEAIEREVLEEAGIYVRARQLAALIDREKWPHHPPYDRHIYKLLFVCESAGGVDYGFRSSETSAIAFFDIDDLPTLSRSRVLPGQIKLLHRHWMRPGIAEFD